jgi:hypothetical protein
MFGTSTSLPKERHAACKDKIIKLIQPGILDKSTLRSLAQVRRRSPRSSAGTPGDNKMPRFPIPANQLFGNSSEFRQQPSSNGDKLL